MAIFMFVSYRGDGRLMINKLFVREHPALLVPARCRSDMTLYQEVFRGKGGQSPPYAYVLSPEYK